jgi:PAS domain S-box-containing protein
VATILIVDDATFIAEHNQVLTRKLEKKLADNERLEARNAQLGKILAASQNEIFVFEDDQLRFTFVNQGALEHLGYDAQELQGLTPLELCPELSAEALAAMLKSLRDGAQEKLVLETSFRKKDGTTYPVALNLEPILNGRELSFLAVVQDITQRRHMETEFRQAQKMEAVGRLAGGVAHDFNNMLNVILINAELCLMGQELTEAHRQRVLEIQEAAERSAVLTRQLLAFSRRQPAQPKRLDLNEVVRENQKMLNRMIEGDIELTFQPGPDLAPVFIDPSQVSQVLANLVINARDALPGAGTISIETANTQVDEDSRLIHGDLAPGAYVRLTVSDTGSGMDDYTLDHLFEPFFTTKGEGKGTGLGLATVYGIIKQNLGAITVYSHLGLGSCFKIYLPVRQDPAGGAEPDLEAPAVGGTETILVAEDEKPMLNVIRMALEGKGYRVLTASSPLDAFLQAQRHPGRLHMLITDVVMPGMNGKDLQERITQILPGLKVLFISGYTGEVIAKRGLLPGDLHFIQKPFRIQDLARKVREVLDS